MALDLTLDIDGTDALSPSGLEETDRVEGGDGSMVDLKTGQCKQKGALRRAGRVRQGGPHERLSYRLSTLISLSALSGVLGLLCEVVRKHEGRPEDI